MPAALDLLSVRQAALVLQLHPSRIRALAARGRLRGTKVGRDWVFEEVEVQRLAEEPRRRGRMPAWLIEFIWDKSQAEKLGHDVSSTTGDLRNGAYTKCRYCGAELAYGFQQDRQIQEPARYLDSALSRCTGPHLD